ncbi:MAG: carboxysome peptide B [Chromatiaceae bacterium]|nr:MAG: carboxysome peptide B [Chromatiaceae bacterium]
MDINQVVGTLVCTYRIPGLEHCSLRILKDRKGKLQVATDPVGTRPGNWVFTASGSAGRYAMGDASILTDLTIGGIIDHWEPETLARTAPATSRATSQAPAPDSGAAQAA